MRQVMALMELLHIVVGGFWGNSSSMSTGKLYARRIFFLQKIKMKKDV